MSPTSPVTETSVETYTITRGPDRIGWATISVRAEKEGPQLVEFEAMLGMVGPFTKQVMVGKVTFPKDSTAAFFEDKEGELPLGYMNGDSGPLYIYT